MPKLTRAGGCFLSTNKELTKLELPRLTQVGDRFLCSNKMLIRLEVPKLPELREQFSEIIDRNASRESGNRIITPQSIAQLDKDSKLTTTEVDAGKIIEETQNKDDTRKI